MNETGSVYKSDLAMKYFPKAATPKLARDNLTRWINRCKPLSMEMARTWPRYNTQSRYYTRQQVEIIYKYLGEP